MKPRAARRGVPGERLIALFDRPWLHRWAYAFIFVCGLVMFVLLTVLVDRLAGLARNLILMGGLIPIGFAQIVLSRSIASQRDALPVFLLVFLEGRWAMLECTPGYFRLGGSASIGIGVGFGVCGVVRLLASMALGAWVGLIVGFLVALSIWVWTWFAFPGTDDN